MRVSELTLRQFRNYTQESLHFNPNLNILVGDNAQGKTNVIEALYFLALGRSHRTHLDAELIQWEKDWASLVASLSSDLGKAELKARLQVGKRKRFQISGNELKSLSQLYGHLTVVLFSPDDLQLVKGSPSLRRQFLDVLLAQVSAVYRRYLVDYSRVLQQRNSTLKLISEKKSGLEMLEVFDPQLVELGSRIIQERFGAVRSLSERATEIHRQMTGDAEVLAMAYVPFFVNRDETQLWEYSDEPPPFERITEMFEAALQRKRRDEQRRGVTLVGPQRDDISFAINDVDARTYGSQGQQRTVVLSCKLAEAEFIRTQTGEYPVLLLDDVMSELDAGRRRFFVEAIKKKIQIVLTTTGLHSFTEPMLRDASVSLVKSGVIEPFDYRSQGRAVP